MRSQERAIKAAVAIIFIFAAGLILFFILSAPYGDGLEKTLEEAGVEEGEPAYHAPLDYGEDYATTLLMGIIGFVAVLLALLTIGRFLGRENESLND